MQNLSEQALTVKAYVWSSFHLDENAIGNAVRVESGERALLHYRRDVTVAICGEGDLYGYQAGAAEASLRFEKLLGASDSLGSDGALAYRLQTIAPNETALWSVVIAFGQTRSQALERIREAYEIGVARLLDDTRKYWETYLQQARVIECDGQEVKRLYRRSLLVFGLMADTVHGGLIAAPEFDPEWNDCGGYGYCWGRDAAFIATAIARAGYAQTSERFFEWALRVQDEDGKWDHRHYVNGMLAPSWGLQIDESASILWGVWQHYLLTEDDGFLTRMWDSLSRGADYLSGLIDERTGLQTESVDLWEERFAQHTYTAGAVCAALRAVTASAQRLGKAKSVYLHWQAAADRVAKAIETTLWNERRDCLYRSLRLHLHMGQEGIYEQVDGQTVFCETDEFGYQRVIRAHDDVVDVSLLGLSYPFAVFAPDDIRARKVSDAVRKSLWSSSVGGVLRYENDVYIGGNPWILTTLWLGLEGVRRGDTALGVEMLQWAADHQTALGLLPEQVDKQTGETRWVVPLTWSHAMFVLLTQELAERGVDFCRG